MTFGAGLGGALSPLGLTATRNITFTAHFYEYPTDAVLAGESLLPILRQPGTVLDTLQLNAIPTAAKAVLALLADTTNISEAHQVYMGLRVFERLAITDTIARNSIDGVSTADIFRLSEAVSRGVIESLADSVTTTDTLSVIAAVAVIEALGLTETVLARSRSGITATELLQVSEALGQFFGGALADTVTVNEIIASTGVFSGVLTEAVALTPTLGARLLVRVVAEDTVEISDTEALNLLFSPTLTDTIDVTAGYVSPDGSLTAWAMNTRTAGVTEYDNFEFNSFGILAGRSVGATSAGLYELTGDDDAGDAIIARIKSGFMQFGGTKLSSLKAAYLATRGDAGFVLRIETGQGELYNYAVSTRDMRSTKVHMGKGLRARYFSFELISEGEDFDIDTLEFVPIVMQRRV